MLATIGLPGLVSWDVRARLVDLSVTSEPVRLLVILGGLASLAYYGRIAVVGARSPSALVILGASERPRWPMPAEAEDPSPIVPASGRAGAATAGAARLEARARVGWLANRAPIASAGVFVLAVTALAVAGGGLGAAAAAAAPAPEPVAPTEIFVPGQTEPPSPGASESAEPSAEPSVEPSSEPSQESGSETPSSAPSTTPETSPSEVPTPSGVPSPTPAGTPTLAPTVAPSA